MELKELRNKKILILGFGREGQDTLRFLRKLFPNKIIGIADKNCTKPSLAQKVEWYLGENYLKAIEKYDVIIKSPGIPIHLPEIEKARGKITSQTEIFFDNCPGTVVGITGTKGKSTTTSLIYEILKGGGFKTHLLGNIGKPVLSFLLRAKNNDVFVYELSSHQLRKLKKSPQIAVFLNIYPEHLDYYKDLREYAAAKANIAKYQTKNDFLVFNSNDNLIKKLIGNSKAKKIPIKGEYYDLDIAAAREVGKIFKIPEKTIQKSIKSFKYLPHRLERVGTFKGITFYNDALATIPEATIGALKVLGQKVETIMLGGYDRNIDFEKLAEEIRRSKVKTAILFPTTGQKIWQSLKTTRIRPFFTDNMKDAVKIAYQNTRPGKICLLSTASSSFSIFKDYKEKGNLFKQYVRKFSGKKDI